MGDLYDVAREVCHDMGMPWTDPRTGKTHEPPQQQGIAMEQTKMDLAFNPETYIEREKCDGGQFEGSVGADIRVSCNSLEELNGVRCLLASAPALLAVCEGFKDCPCVENPGGYSLLVNHTKMEAMRAVIDAARPKASDAD